MDYVSLYIASWYHGCKRQYVCNRKWGNRNPWRLRAGVYHTESTKTYTHANFYEILVHVGRAIHVLTFVLTLCVNDELSLVPLLVALLWGLCPPTGSVEKKHTLRLDDKCGHMEVNTSGVFELSHLPKERASDSSSVLSASHQVFPVHLPSPLWLSPTNLLWALNGSERWIEGEIVNALLEREKTTERGADISDESRKRFDWAH